MGVKQILIHPDPRLKKVSAPVKKVTTELRKLAEDMLQTMYAAPGIGLAAPQVGVLKQLVVIDCVKDEESPPDPRIFFNPAVTWASDETGVYEEGCLSIPDQYGEVTRPAEIRAEWLDMDGQAHEEHFDGLLATCLQHEIDHLRGKLFIDYLSPVKRQMITRKMVKIKRERARM